jgi:hypothetical protein
MNDDIDELDDAIIEDTVHCDVCNCTMICGDNDCLIDDAGLCLCQDCCGSAADLWKRYIDEMGLCWHGVPKNEQCDDCINAPEPAPTNRPTGH